MVIEDALSKSHSGEERKLGSPGTEERVSGCLGKDIEGSG